MFSYNTNDNKNYYLNYDKNYYLNDNRNNITSMMIRIMQAV